MRLFHRRHPDDIASLGELQRKLNHEHARVANLARENAELREAIGHLVTARDHYRGRNRELVAELVKLKGERRRVGAGS